MKMILQNEKKENDYMKEGIKTMNFKKILSMVVAGAMAFCTMSFTVLAEEPEVPTATVTQIEAPEDIPLTFALNFEAVEPTQEQLEKYENWYADYVLTVNKDITFNADGTKDGYLAGSYEGYQNGAWVTVPLDDVEVKANTPLSIIEYANSLMGGSEKVNYNEIWEQVKSFNCGIYFSDEFLAANPDLEVSLELRMWNNQNEDEYYTVGAPYEFVATRPALPTATITELNYDDLTFALNFSADKISEEQLAEYADWYVDFEFSVNKDVTFNANGTEDGYLAGSYENWQDGAWIKVPFENVELKAGDTLKIMDYASTLMGKPGLKYTYAEVFSTVKDFNCGVFFSDEFLAANPDLKVGLSLNMYNPDNAAESYTIGSGYTFDELKATSISVEYEERIPEDADGEIVYDIYLKANDGYEINELASADLSFLFEKLSGNVQYKVNAVDEMTLTQDGVDTDRYMFNYNGVDEYEGTGPKLKIGEITVTGYGSFSLSTKEASTNAVHATTLHNNVVDSYVVGGDKDDNSKTGNLIINENTNSDDNLYGSFENVEINRPASELTIKIDFPNTVVGNAADFQKMTLKIDGATFDETINLGYFAEGKDYYEYSKKIPNEKYTVTVEGAGYRTAVHTFKLEEDTTLNFWNNVRDDDKMLEVQKGVASTAGRKNFLAGDIVKDNVINIYDLSAVVSYFGTKTNDSVDNYGYAKYDLDRNGIIDSKDVAYILVSWEE